MRHYEPTQVLGIIHVPMWPHVLAANNFCIRMCLDAADNIVLLVRAHAEATHGDTFRMHRMNRYGNDYNIVGLPCALSCADEHRLRCWVGPGHGCHITADGILSEDVKTELTATPLTGKIPTRGGIKVISSASWDPTAPIPSTGLRGTATHIQAAGKSAYATTETAFADANLGQAEFSLLPQLCYFADTLLSGVGCTCTPEDHDF